MGNKYKDLTGKKFGRLFVHSYYGTQKRVYWLCKCDCGKLVIIDSWRLTSGNTKSCGCLRKELASKRRSKESGEASFNRLFRIYKDGARKRKIFFDLTKEEFKVLSDQNCFYCRIEPKQLVNANYLNGDYIHNGIDRIDSSKGYIIENCVPCCKRCNQAKNDMTQSEFKDWIKRVYNNLF